MLKDNNNDTRRHWRRCSGVSTVNFEHIIAGRVPI